MFSRSSAVLLISSFLGLRLMPTYNAAKAQLLIRDTSAFSDEAGTHGSLLPAPRWSIRTTRYTLGSKYTVSDEDVPPPGPP